MLNFAGGFKLRPIFFHIFAGKFCLFGKVVKVSKATAAHQHLMFLYPPITRLADTSEETSKRVDSAFKDVFMPVLQLAKQNPCNFNWKRQQRKEFRKLAFALHDAELDKVIHNSSHAKN
jgi:hypothetical protein